MSRVEPIALTTTEESQDQQLRGSSNNGRNGIRGKGMEIDVTSAAAAFLMVTIATKGT